MKQDFCALKPAIETFVRRDFRATGRFSPGMPVEVIGFNPLKTSTLRVRTEDNTEEDLGETHLALTPAESGRIRDARKALKQSAPREEPQHASATTAH